MWLNGDANITIQLDGDLSFSESLNGEMGIIEEHSSYKSYTGATEFTPSAEVQTIEVKDKIVLDNITINPIPNNYGLIGWNGSYLTVS